MSHQNFLFSSVGDNTNFDEIWIDDSMNYDIYIIYYGNNVETFKKYQSKVTFIESRKGSKFQNFKYFYDKYKDIIETYDRFFILDDDIIMNVNDINEMFQISKQYKLDVCSPSLSKDSKVSHKITIHQPNKLLTYTNFVEVGYSLYNKNALQKLMKQLDETLIGWGIDLLSIYCNGIDKQKSYAIVHNIVCKNPKDNEKKNKRRELENITKCNLRRQLWEIFANKHKLKPYFTLKTYTSINL